MVTMNVVDYIPAFLTGFIPGLLFGAMQKFALRLLLAWISTDKNPTNAKLTQGIHLTREFGAVRYPK
jgi:hypothetical protein